MKKLFTLAAAVLASVCLWAAEYTIQVGNVDTKASKDSVYTTAGKLADGTTLRHVYVKSNGTYTSTDITNTTGIDVEYGNKASTSAKMSSTSNLGPTLVSGSKTHLQVAVDAGDSVVVYWFHSSTLSNKNMVVSKKKADDPAKGEEVQKVKFSLPTSKKTGCCSWKSTISDTAYFAFDATVYVYAIKVITVETCDAPAKALVLSSDAAATVYVGDVVTFTTGDTGNGGTVTIEGANSETITDSKWTATEGEHTFTASQAKNGDFCAQESELKLSVKAKTPVTACSIEGPTAGYKGNKVTYTATAANATAYRWTVDGAIQEGAESATFEFTPSASRTYKIVGQARNDFNATSEWISSDPISLTATSLYGTLVSYVVDGGTAAKDKTGALSAVSTPKVSLTSGSSSKLTVDEVEYTGYKMDKGKYVGVTLSSGSFAEGDSVFFLITTKTGSAKLYLYNDEAGTLRLDSIEGYIESVGRTGWVYFVLNQATTGVYMYRSNPDVKPYDQNPYIAAVKVVRPMPVKSVAESLTAVKVDGVAISSEDLTTLLSSAYKVDLAAAYAAAPEVEFNKHVVKTFEDDSQDVSDVPVKVTAEKNGLGRWEAKTTINAIEYTVTAGVNASATIIYMDGEEKLGEEVVAINGNPAKYGDYQTKKLSTFKGWYSDKALTSAVTIASAVIDKDTTFYAKFENAYASSVNIEKLVLDNGTKYDLMGYMGGLNYATNIANSLDTLNDLEKKDNRNYAYLGLKVKAAGKLLDFRLADGATLKVKFGAYKAGSEPQVSINGAAYAAMEITDGVYSHTASGEELVSIKTATADAVVFKQIMIGEDLKDVELPAPGAYLVTCAEAENGTVTAAWPNKKYRTPVGETVTLTVTPNDGYKVADVKVNGESLNAVEGVYSFPMPAQDVTVVATFSVVTAIDNTEAAVKATKVVRDGQLYIEKNGVLYNAQGAVVR